MHPYINESKLDTSEIYIRTSKPVYITMSTIPARLPNTFKLIKHILTHIQGFEKIILNIPYSYKRWTNLKINVSNDITDSRFILNRCEDMGPMTKFLPTIDLIPRNAILIICDDMCYKLSAFKDIAEMQDKYYDRAFSFYVYNYSGGSSLNSIIQVPQGADLISTTSNNIKGFQKWFQNFISATSLSNYKDSPCFYVDDQVIAWYFKYAGIPMQQVEDKHRNIYIQDCDVSDEKQNLNKQTGKNERNNVMIGCYNQMSSIFGK